MELFGVCLFLSIFIGHHRMIVDNVPFPFWNTLEGTQERTPERTITQRQCPTRSLFNNSFNSIGSGVGQSGGTPKVDAFFHQICISISCPTKTASKTIRYYHVCGPANSHDHFWERKFCQVQRALAEHNFIRRMPFLG